MNAGVDVVVPIYEAADDLEVCLRSVFAGTDHPDVRIVLADDGSSDPRVGQIIDRASEDPRVVVSRSSVNRGFVATCNAAMAASDRDVVLLNSDTEVGPGWLSRLQRYAYLVERVGSVTPWSDNATVCSVPSWFEGNTFPSRVTTGMLDAIAADLAAYDLLEIPTGVGFCLYLRREALDEVGLFDPTFGRGYGEENDLCCRLRHAGYLNLLADGVFVRHRGGASFGGTGRLEENLETVRRRWPAYSRSVAALRDADPFRGLRARFGAETAARGRDPGAIRPLYVMHYRTRSGRKGGTEHHVQDLIDAAGRHLDALILTAEDGAPVAQWDTGDGAISFPASIAPEDSGWSDRLLDLGVDVLHVQQPKRTRLDDLERLQAGARNRGIPVVWTLHDYYTICPCIQLVHADGTPCPVADDEACAECESLARREAGVGLGEWRRRHAALVEAADVVVSPSTTAAELQGRLLTIPTPRVFPHGSPHAQTTVVPPEGRTRQRLVVLGYSAPQKGNRVAAGLVEALGDRVEWVFLGRRHLPGVEASELVRFAGEYDRGDLPDILSGLAPDAIVLLSTWPETFLYTLSEARRCGIPVFGSDVGAMGERLREGGGGVLLPAADVLTSADIITTTLADAGTMDRLRRESASAGSREPTIEVMAEQYVAMYGSLVGATRRTAHPRHPAVSDTERSAWLGSFPVPFPAPEAVASLRSGSTQHV